MQMGDVGCPLCVPMYVAFKVSGKQLPVEQWKQRNGYRCGARPIAPPPLPQPSMGGQLR